MRLFSINKKTTKAWLLGGTVVVLLGAVTIAVLLQAKERPKKLAPPSATLRIIFQEEINGQTQTADGTATLTGDCLPIPGRSQKVGSVNQKGKITLETVYGNTVCRLAKTGWPGDHYSADDKTYLIASLSFSRRTNKTLYIVPLTGINSLSPLRLRDSSNLIVFFKADGTIATTVEKLPPTIE